MTGTGADRVWAARELRGQQRWMALLGRVRPARLVEPLVRFLQRRRYTVAYQDVLLSISPYSYLGAGVLNGAYEPDTEAWVRRALPPGGVFIDVGANEGFYCALAARIAGAAATIIAIEPQQALGALIETNVALNGTCRPHVLRAVAGSRSGEAVDVHIFPAINHGGSGVVHAYRFGGAIERVTTVSVDDVTAQAGLASVDLIKIDVEGFEWEVVNGMRELLAAHRVGTVLLDYHEAILARRGIAPGQIEALLLAAGYRCVDGAPSGGHAVYRPAA